jgi:hypothetical protein
MVQIIQNIFSEILHSEGVILQGRCAVPFKIDGVQFKCILEEVNEGVKLRSRSQRTMEEH